MSKLTIPLILCTITLLSGCDKIYTPADFMKDSTLRNGYAQQCEKSSQIQSKNCQNLRLAQQKIQFATQQGKTEFVEKSSTHTN